MVLGGISGDAYVQDMIPRAHYYVRSYTNNSFNCEPLGLTHTHIENNRALVALSDMSY